MSRQRPETSTPDDVAEEKARRQSAERQAVADGAAEPRPDEAAGGAAEDEAAYSTEGEQGAAQPAPR
ncbi:MAG: hypothetical protein AB7O74_06800 [Candidatus Nanopelagicales bacterium]